MPAEPAVIFDQMAPDYDQVFTDSLIGKAQRAQVRKYLMELLEVKPVQRILEINCGTGEDASWLASMGYTVTATDVSPEMIRVAREKAGFQTWLSVSYKTMGFDELDQLQKEGPYDLVLSNFSGLNCIDKTALTQLNTQLQKLVADKGELAIVIFGKYCIWETCYHFIKGRFRTAFRRWNKKPADMHLPGNTPLPVWYHSRRQLSGSLSGFTLYGKKPVGLFVPPSYLEDGMKKRPRLFSFLQKMDQKCSGSWLSNFADHRYLLYRKKVS